MTIKENNNYKNKIEFEDKMIRRLEEFGGYKDEIEYENAMIEECERIGKERRKEKQEKMESVANELYEGLIIANSLKAEELRKEEKARQDIENFKNLIKKHCVGIKTFIINNILFLK